MPDERVAAVVAFFSEYRVEPASSELSLIERTALGLRDPDDEPIVRTAVASGADLLVSGDRDLTEAKLPIRVVMPRGLWDTLRTSGTSGEVHEP